MNKILSVSNGTGLRINRDRLQTRPDITILTERELNGNKSREASEKRGDEKYENNREEISCATKEAQKEYEKMTIRQNENKIMRINFYEQLIREAYQKRVLFMLVSYSFY